MKPNWFKLWSLQLVDLSRFIVIDQLGATIILRESSPSGINIRHEFRSPQDATIIFNKICKKLMEIKDELSDD